MVDCVYHIIAGCGHMWFLPMLFWCFIFGWIILNLRVNDVYMMALLLLLYIVPVPFSIPFQVGKVPEFMCFFYAGVIAYKYRSQLLSKTKGKTIVALWGIFMILFVGLKCIDDIYIVPEKTNAGYFMIYDIYSNILSLVYKSVGVITLFQTALWTTTKCTTNNFLQIFASCSFGIYIFQQFILKYLYYKTPFPEFVGPYWLPWLGFVMVLLISFLCAFYLRKLKIGKFLLG